MKQFFLSLIFCSLFSARLSAQLVINEILADPPPGDLGDANGDGFRDGSSAQDEFIELVNTSGGALDLDGWAISDRVGVRHAFTGSTVLADGQALVVFGGGTPSGNFGGAIVMLASSGTLGLNNSGDTITILNAGNEAVVTLEYGGEGGNNTSLNLDPELTGTSYVEHLALGDGTRAFSPGTRSDGSPFAGEVLTVSVDPATFSEGAGAGAAIGTVTRTGDLSEAITVDLVSSDTTEVEVPASVTIAAGQDSANFSVTAVDDTEQDSVQSATLTASARGIFSGTFVLLVEDDEDPIPTIMMAAEPVRISEDSGSAVVTIEVSAPSDAGYVFDLSGDDASELSVPVSVMIPAGATMASFVVNAINDEESDGAQSVTVRASDPAAIISSAEVNMIVTDDEAFTAPAIVINELRTDNVGADTEEYLEIYGATADFSLDRVWLIVIGDRGGTDSSGNIDRAYELTGLNATGNYFLIANDNILGGTPDFTAGINIFENGDSSTFLLVTDFTGSTNEDLDVDNDGVLDNQPWSDVLDAVSIVEPGDAPAVVGLGYAVSLGFPGADVTSETDFVPAHVFRSPDGTGAWFAGPFGSEEEPATDSPGAENGGEGEPPVEDDEVRIVNFFVEADGVTAVIVATGLGSKLWKIETSDALGDNESWLDLTGGFVESDNPDGSTNFTFSTSLPQGDEKHFYRLSEQ